MANHTTLHINCDADEEKRRWMLTARIEGMAFDEWVRKKLNACIIDDNPPWLDGLSERTRICLLGAGFGNLAEVRIADSLATDFSLLPNAGTRVRDEVLKWLSDAPGSMKKQNCFSTPGSSVTSKNNYK